MMKARCPICSKIFEADRTALPPGFPFCSERCRLIDLGRWIDGDYAIPGSSPERAPESSQGDGAPNDLGDPPEDSES